MSTDVVNNLPEEFNFKSNINSFGIVYHAIKTSNGYTVTCDESDCRWLFSSEKMMKSIRKGDYVVL